jgi:hypothetical protein
VQDVLSVLIVRAEEGKVVESRVEDTKLEDAARAALLKAAETWNPLTSDLTAVHGELELRYKLPIDPDLYDRVMELNLEVMREGNEVIVKLPVIVISFDNEWLGDKYRDKKIYVVSHFLDEESRRQVEEYASEATKEPKSLEGSVLPQELEISEEEMRRLEEGLEEAEEEKPRKRKKSTRKKSK